MIKDKKLINRSEEEFKELIYSLVDKNTHELLINLNKINFRKMKTKWASISPLKTLTVNILAKYLPEYLIKYIIYHELTQDIMKNFGK